jgi:hypothetical protein
MVTPSGWHDDAARRDGGHDEMQMKVWQILKRQAEELEKNDPDDRDLRSLAVELPMIRRGSGIVAFADIALLWQDRNNYEIKRAVLYEIKPKIWTIFGILRQAICLERAFLLAYPNARCLVEAVVPHDDPKLHELAELITCKTWNRETGELRFWPPRPR